MNIPRMGIRAGMVGISCLFLFSLMVTIGALDARGQVKGYQKISDTQGGFEGGLEDNEAFGTAQASLGDLDGDGVNDIAVGAYFDGYTYDAGPGPGAMWVLFLETDGTVKAYKKITQNSGGFTGTLDRWDEFGISATSLGDLDGDGITDLAVGARSDDDGGENRGAVWVLFLNADGSVKNHQKISSTVGGFTGTLDNFDSFGTSLAWMGDFNGDGFGDLAVGAFQDDDGGPDHGAVWILTLNQDGTVRSHNKISSTQGGFTGTLDESDRFGQAAAPIGDLDSDGIGDLVVGAYLDDDGGSDAGALWVLFLNSDGSVKANQKISATEGNFNGPLDAGDNFGVGAGWLGDTDGDGFPEMVVGAIGDDDGGTNRGAVWLLDLDTDGSVNSSVKISATQGGFTGPLDNYDYFGHNAISVGDLDNDGRADVSVGAFGDDDGGNRRGAVWVLFFLASPCIVAPIAIDFDSVEVGLSADTTFVIANTGSDIISGDVTASCADYAIVSGGGPFDLAPTESLTVTVRFAPTAVGTRTCTVSTGVCASVSFTGLGVESVFPHIVSVADVGNDQGRQVRITHSRSGYDAPPSTIRILQYEVYRRIDPLLSPPAGETGTDRGTLLKERAKEAVNAGMRSDPGSLLLGWDYIGAVPAHGDAVYHMVAPTLADSTVDDGVHWSVFFIRAATANPFTYFDSPPDSGYSVDNLAPRTPTGFSVVYNAPGGNALSWEPAEDPDFRYFCIYRDVDPDFSPAPENLIRIHLTVETTWLDTVDDGWKYHYKITAVDLAGNVSAPSSPGQVTGIGPGRVPQRSALYQNVPNPFNPETLISYDVSAGGGWVTLEVYDVLGRRVRTLADRHESAGSKRITWDGTDDRGQRVGSGVYFYRLRAPGYEASLKMMLLE